MIKIWLQFLFLSLIFLGCDSKDTPTQEETYTIPQTLKDAQGIFTAGDDQNALEGEDVHLENSILDKNITMLSYLWLEDGEVLGREKTLQTDNLSVGTHIFTVIATDSNGNSYEDQITVIIKKEDLSNTPPLAYDFDFTLEEDSSDKTYLRGSDAEGNSLRYLFVTQPLHGTLSGSAANLIYTPIKDYHGTDSFTFKTNDGTIDSNIATASIMIMPVNDAPAWEHITVNTKATAGSLYRVTLPVFDIDGDEITITVSDNLPNWLTVDKFILSGTPTFDDITIGRSPTVIFTADDGEKRSTYAFPITVIDPRPHFSNAPIMIDTDEDNLSVHGQFTSSDANTTFSIGGKNSIAGFSLESNGSYHLNLNSVFYQSLNKDENYSHDLLIELTDGTYTREQNMTIMIRGVNDAPVAYHDNNTTNEDTNITFNILANDTDIDNNASLTLLDVNTTEGNVTFTPDGSLTFSPIGYFDGLTVGQEHNVTLTYIMQDEHNATDEANVTIMISGVDDTLNIDTSSLSIDSNLSVDNGTISGKIEASDDDTTLTYTTNYTDNNFEINSTGHYTFTPSFQDYLPLQEGQTQTITVPIMIGTVDTNITITIIGRNDAPVAVNDNLTVYGTTVIDVLGNDTDVDNNKSDLTIQFLLGDSNGSLYLNSDLKSIIYTADENFSGEDIFRYTISDGNATSNEATVTVTVERPFIMTVDINDSNSLSFKIPINSDPKYAYNYGIDCNGTGNYTTTSDEFTCEYTTLGEYNISIIGDFPHIRFASSSQENSNKLKTIQQWGDIKWESMKSAFIGCQNMNSIAKDSPNLQSVTDMSWMFASFNGGGTPTTFNQDINDWNVSNVEDMSYMFYFAQDFNGSIKDWDVSKVTDMNHMFYAATNFDSNISAWDVSSVVDMNHMFPHTSFNQDIGDWNVSSVTKMYNMLANTSFNQDIGGWNVSNVTDMNHMFDGATNFDSNISAWDVSSVIYMQYMFYKATSFNANLEKWDVSKVKYMHMMFQGTQFNQDISGWDVSNVTNMQQMFHVTPFNQDISNWNVSNVTNMTNMLSSSNLTSVNYDRLLGSWSTLSLQENVKFDVSADLTYTDINAHNILINSFQWTISDGGLDPDAPTHLSFEAHIIDHTMSDPEHVYPSDIDRDGFIDIVVADDGGSSGWFKNDRNGSVSSEFKSISDSSAEGIFSIDLDRDGDMDILVGVNESDAVVWYENDGSENFSKQPENSGAIKDSHVIATDIDKDGYMDILISTWDGKIAWYENDGSQHFTEHEVASNLGQTNTVIPADFDNDGDIDIVAAHYENGNVAWYENKYEATDDNLTFTPHNLLGDNNTRKIYSVSVADIDQDGFQDIIAGPDKTGKLYVLKNNQDKTFSSQDLNNTATDWGTSDTGDLDNDGDIDILYASYDNDEIGWYINDGTGSFSEKQIISDSFEKQLDIYTADLDNDGDLDFVVSLQGDGKVAWFENTLRSGEEVQSLPRTGQTTSYSSFDDGDLKKGLYSNFTKNIITDNSSGLMWQDNTDATDKNMIWADAMNYCEDSILGGFHDWRLPEIQTLYYLAQKDSTDALAQPFENVSDSHYWSSDLNPNLNYATYVDFSDATENYVYTKEFTIIPAPKKNVRCVRGNRQKFNFSRDDIDNIVTDSTHKLAWHDSDEANTTTRTWEGALDYCAGMGDKWRLPNIHELYSIVDPAKSTPAFESTFVYTTSEKFWSSTTDNTSNSSVEKRYGIHFATGHDFKEDVSSKLYNVRCVRDIP